jgi:hypothetical protein
VVHPHCSGVTNLGQNQRRRGPTADQATGDP